MLRCPTDDTTLTLHRYGETLVGSCPACHGLWFERDQALRAHALDHTFEPPTERGDPLPPPPRRGTRGAVTGARVARRCAHCGERLRPRFIAEIEVDVCSRRRGIWLDAGEFAAIRGWYAREGPNLPRGRSVAARPVQTMTFTGSDLASQSGEFVLDVIVSGAAEAVFSFVGAIFEGLFDAIFD